MTSPIRLDDKPAPSRASTSASSCRDTLYIAHSPLETITSYLPSIPYLSSSSSKTPPRRPSFLDDPLAVGILSAVGGVALTWGGLRGYRRYWKRIRNPNDVTTQMLERKRWIKGVVTSVGDGDNFRLFHTPGPFYDLPLKIRSIPTTPKELKDETLHIRISGIDAPEAAHFGNPAQPHSKESLDWLRETLLEKRMSVQLLRKDQYNRIVGIPYIRRRLWWDKPLPPLMLRQGMAVVYESGGAEYGPWGLEGLKRFEAEARRAKRGLWGLKKFEHPADYKKRMKVVEEGMAGADETAKRARASQSKGVLGILRRIFSAS